MTLEELVALYEPPDSVPPMPALDGLEQVDWSSVNDAYGPATKLPAILRALVSGSTEHLNYATQALFETVWHQGTVYSATAAVLPTLFELLETDGPHLEAVAVLLATIADGRPSFAHCEDNPAEADRWRAILAKAGRSLDTEMAEGRRIAAEIRRLMSARLDLLLPYLRSSQPDVRASVAVALGLFSESASRFLSELLEARQNETDPYVRKSLDEVLMKHTRPRT